MTDYHYHTVVFLASLMAITMVVLVLLRLAGRL